VARTASGASPFSHAGDVEQHVTYGKEDGAIAIKIIPGADEDVVRTMETASFMLWVIVSRINERFGLGHDAIITAGKPEMMLRHERSRQQKTRQQPQANQPRTQKIRPP